MKPKVTPTAMPTTFCSISFTAVDAVDTFSATLTAVCDVISETDSEDLLLDSVSDAVVNLADAEAVFVSIFVGEPGSDCDVAVETVVVVVLEPRSVNRACHMLTCKYAIRSFGCTRLQSISKINKTTAANHDNEVDFFATSARAHNHIQGRRFSNPFGLPSHAWAHNVVVNNLTGTRPR